jgi:hypothetical protein
MNKKKGRKGEEDDEDEGMKKEFDLFIPHASALCPQKTDDSKTKCKH